MKIANPALFQSYNDESSEYLEVDIQKLDVDDVSVCKSDRTKLIFRVIPKREFIRRIAFLKGENDLFQRFETNKIDSQEPRKQPLQITNKSMGSNVKIQHKGVN